MEIQLFNSQCYSAMLFEEMWLLYVMFTMASQLFLEDVVMLW
jgi:hypothetical protein